MRFATCNPMTAQAPLDPASQHDAAATAAATAASAASVARIERQVLATLYNARIPVLVGGSVAIVRYTGVQRPVKDLDLFLRPADFDRAAQVLAESGCRVERAHPHWLGKAHAAGHCVDLIYGSGNGLMPVDEPWFQHARPASLHGVPVGLVPPEELLWTKMFVMERERYDGADVLHLLRDLGPILDWARLEERFGTHWRVLLGHLVMFGYVFPSERRRVPGALLERLLQRLRDESNAEPPPERICRGTLLSRQQYLRDLDAGWLDARIEEGAMSAAEIAEWTAGIALDGDGAAAASSAAPAPAPAPAPFMPFRRRAVDRGELPATPTLSTPRRRAADRWS